MAYIIDYRVHGCKWVGCGKRAEGGNLKVGISKSGVRYVRVLNHWEYKDHSRIRSEALYWPDRNGGNQCKDLRRKFAIRLARFSGG